ELRRVADEPLVELVGAGDEHRRRLATAADGPAGLLPERGDRAGEAVEHDRVEAADVDAQLEGGGGDDAGQAPVEQLVLDAAPLLGEVAAPVGADASSQRAGEPAADVGGDDLGAPAAPGEGEGRVPRLDDPGCHGG